VAGARDQLAALLPIRERVLGSEHPATLTDRHGLAGWTADAGDAAGARDQYGALLPIRERVSGPEHPATLAIRGNHPLLPRRARQVRHDVAARRPWR
jgi:Tetratricopeptide repeat